MGFPFFINIFSLFFLSPEICLESLTSLKEIKKIKEKNGIYENCFSKYNFSYQIIVKIISTH